ncbi:peptide ABC transporter substrate-binding protein [Bacillus gobiensis]|uniref:peptide ABC transporter substrate-binding protein n=1 Tax=Bacillus gobiensis TaxID=1441095 RepID=UPI003D1CBBF5
MKRLSVFLSVLLFAFALLGCTANEQASENSGGNSEEKQVLRLNNTKEPTSYDPPKGFDNLSWQSLNNIMEGLTRLGKNHEPEAAAAEKWEVSDDGKTYTFKIRDNAKWSNGDDVTAEDFEYAWKRLLDPKKAYDSAFLGYFIEGGEAYNSNKGSADDVQVSAEDTKTLKVTLTSPQKYFLSVISNPAFFPVNKKVDEENPEWFAEDDSFVGNGPFKLTEWKHNESIKMAKSDTYWDKDTVKLDEVTWAMVDDENTDYQMFQNGELDTASVPAEMAEQLLKQDNVKVDDQAGLYYYRFNVKLEPFQNEKIRKAFAMAVDQQEIVDYVTKNGEKPARGYVSPGFSDPSGNDFRETNGDLITYNPDEAKKLLEEGMTEEKYSELPEITLTYSSTPQHKLMAEAIQQKFKDVLGVDVKLANMEWGVFSAEQKKLKFQLSQSSFLADYADPINFVENFQTGHSMNRTGWSNEKYDQLIKDAKNEADETKRFQLMYEAEKLVFDEMPIIPIHFYNQVNLEAEGVKGIVRHPVGYLELKWAEKSS